MAGRTARRTVVARLLVGTQEPEVRVVQPGLGDIYQRHRDTVAGTRAPVRLPDVRAPWLVQFLQGTGDVGQSDFRKLGAIDLAAALEHPEHVARRHRLPRRQRCQAVQNAHRPHVAVCRHRVLDGRRLAAFGVGLAQDVALVRQDSVVVRSTAPQHGTGGHQAAFGGLYHRQMAGTTRLARDPQVARVDEADELRALAIELGVAARRIRRRRVVPLKRIGRQHM